MTPEQKAVHIEAMHFACRKIRLAIAVLDADVPPDETTIARLKEATELLDDVMIGLINGMATGELHG